jgi:hypothetical protein
MLNLKNSKTVRVFLMGKLLDQQGGYTVLEVVVVGIVLVILTAVIIWR